MRIAYCLILLPLLGAAAAGTVVLAIIGDGAALALGIATLAGCLALAFLLLTVQRKFPGEYDRRSKRETL